MSPNVVIVWVEKDRMRGPFDEPDQWTSIIDDHIRVITGNAARAHGCMGSCKITKIMLLANQHSTEIIILFVEKTSQLD